MVLSIGFLIALEESSPLYLCASIYSIDFIASPCLNIWLSYDSLGVTVKLKVERLYVRQWIFSNLICSKQGERREEEKVEEQAVKRASVCFWTAQVRNAL